MHTPGPWRIEQLIEGHIDIVAGGPVDDGTTKYIATIGDIQHEGPDADPRATLTIPEAWANARLMAAAPEMLDALVKILDPDSRDEGLYLAEAAIRKAKGEGQ